MPVNGKTRSRARSEVSRPPASRAERRLGFRPRSCRAPGRDGGRGRAWGSLVVMGDPLSCTTGRTEPQPMLRVAHDANSRCRPMRRLRRVVADVGREPGFGAPLRGTVVRHGRWNFSQASAVTSRHGWAASTRPETLRSPARTPKSTRAAAAWPFSWIKPPSETMWPTVPCGASARAPPLQRCGTVTPCGAHVGFSRQRCSRSQWMPRTIAPVTKTARGKCLAEPLPRQA